MNEDIPCVKYNSITSAEMANMLLSPFGQAPCKKTQKENTMAYGNQTATAAITVAAQPVDEAKRYLCDRIDQLYWTKSEEINQAFRPLMPKSGKEALKWLKDGNYHFDKHFVKSTERDDEDEDFPEFDGWDFAHALKWGKVPFDSAARDKAFDNLRNAMVKAQDVIKVVTNEETRLQALKEFEAYKVQ